MYKYLIELQYVRWFISNGKESNDKLINSVRGFISFINCNGSINSLFRSIRINQNRIFN